MPVRVTQGAIHLEDAQEVLLGVFVQRNVRPGDPGVVVRRVEPAEDRHCAADGRGHRL